MLKPPFPDWILNTSVKVYHTQLSENGEPVEEEFFDGLCNYDEKSKQVLDSERRLLQLSAKVIFKGEFLRYLILASK